MKTLFIFPTSFEGEAFFRYGGLRGVGVGSICEIKKGENSLYGLISGYGCERSANRVREILRDRDFDGVILCGFAGGCDLSMKRGDIYYDGQGSYGDLFKILGGKSTKIACTSKVVGVEEKAELWRSGYGVVDMESAIFESAIGNVRYGTLRMISDEMGDIMPIRFLNAMIDKRTGGNNFFSLRVMIYLVIEIGKIVGFSRKCYGVKKKYDKLVVELIEIFLQK